MKHPCLLLFFVFSVAAAFSQRGLITCSTERNPDNSLSIYADCQISGEYTLKLIFTEFRGYSSTLGTYPSGGTEVGLVTVLKGRREVAKLTPVKTASVYALSYKYTYFPGNALRKIPDSNFVYLLPGSEGNRLRVSQVSSLAARIGQKATDDFRAVGFVYKLGDTICATRAGIVFDCSDEIKEGEKGAEFYKSNRNRIGIQQKDGTLAQYAVLAPIQLLITAGDYVVPGQPIAVFNRESEKYTVLFSVYYLDEKKALADNSNSSSQRLPSSYSYTATAFYAGPADKPNTQNTLEINKQYTALHPKEIIAAELSKKDKKKLGL